MRTIYEPPATEEQMHAYVQQRRKENAPAATGPTIGEQEFPDWESAIEDAWQKAKAGEIKLADFAKIVAKAAKADQRGEPWQGQ